MSPYRFWPTDQLRREVAYLRAECYPPGFIDLPIPGFLYARLDRAADELKRRAS